jgi:peptide/histidine transporter 3/4
MLLLGARYFRMPPPKGSPYSELARVVVAAVRKGRADVGALGRAQYYVGEHAVADSASNDAPSKRLRFVAFLYPKQDITFIVLNSEL